VILSLSSSFVDVRFFATHDDLLVLFFVEASKPRSKHNTAMMMKQRATTEALRVDEDADLCIHHGTVRRRKGSLDGLTFFFGSSLHRSLERIRLVGGEGSDSQTTPPKQKEDASDRSDFETSGGKRDGC